MKTIKEKAVKNLLENGVSAVLSNDCVYVTVENGSQVEISEDEIEYQAQEHDKDIKVIINPYNEDEGTFWNVILFVDGYVLEDGFESTADAEMWAKDEGYEFDED